MPEPADHDAETRVLRAVAEQLVEQIHHKPELAVDLVEPDDRRTRLRGASADRSADETPRRPTLADRARELVDHHAEYLVVVSQPPSDDSPRPGIRVEPPRDLGQPATRTAPDNRLTLRVADGRTGQVLFSTRVHPRDATDRRAGIERIVSWLAVRPWRSHVVRVDPLLQRIVLSAGSDHGLQAEQVYTVLTDGEPVLDPDTGDELGETMVPIGQVEIVAVTGAEAEAKIVDGCEGIATGDRVLRPTSP